MALSGAELFRWFQGGHLARRPFGGGSKTSALVCGGICCSGKLCEWSHVAGKAKACQRGALVELAVSRPRLSRESAQTRSHAARSASQTS